MIFLALLIVLLAILLGLTVHPLFWLLVVLAVVVALSGRANL